MPDRKKPLLNRSEQRVDHALQEYAAEAGYRINPKTRLRDLADWDESSLDSRTRNFLYTAHVDFSVTDAVTTSPVLVVEYDGPRHADPVQMERDAIKDRLCGQAGIPVLRIDSAFARREGRWTVLRYILWAHQTGQAFHAAQEAGDIPLDEPFYHGSVIDTETGGFTGLDMEAIRYLHDFRNDFGALWQRHWWEDEGRRDRAVDMIALPNDMFLCASCDIVAFAIEGISAHLIAQELATAELGWLARRYAMGEAVAIGPKEGRRWLQELEGWHLSGGWGRTSSENRTVTP